MSDFINKFTQSLLGNQSQSQLRQQVTLICLSITSCLIAFLFNRFIPDVYAPVSVFLLAAGVGFSVVIASLLFEPVLKYLNDLTTFAHLYMYLSVVYLAFISNFEPHLTLLLAISHVFFSISFQSFAEFTLFAISSLVLLILSIHTASPLYFDRHMLVSAYTLITLGAGIANWYMLTRKSIQDEYKNLLSTFLNRNSDAIFLLSEDGNKVVFMNGPGRKFLAYIFQKHDITGQALLDVLGLNKQFLLNRFQSADYHVQERCICQLTVERQRPLKLEIFINKVHIRQGDAFVLTLRDSIHKGKSTSPWINASAPKTEALPQDLHPEPIDLPALVSLILQSLHGGQEQNAPCFTTHIPKIEGLVTDVSVLSSALKHILLSIIHRKRIDGTEAHIYIGVNHDGKYVKFLIQDNGGLINTQLLKVAQSKIEALQSQLQVMELAQTGNIFTFSLSLQQAENSVPR